MAIPQKRPNAAAWLAVLLFCVLHALPVPAAEQQPEPMPDAFREPFSVYELRFGKTASREACAAEPHAVWVEHAHGEECILYYPSGGLDSKSNPPRVAVLVFQGDRLGPAGSNYVGDYGKITPESLTRTMQAYYRRHGVPFILVARPGLFGSSGDHRQRRRAKESRSLDAALDAIKQRYGLERIVIAGQSGGSTAGGAVLTLGRADVACAVLGSGNYDVLKLAEIKRVELGLRTRYGCDITDYCDPYSPSEHIGGIAHDPQRAIVIVGDPADSNTVFELQRKFADAVRAAGHRVDLIEAEGKGPDRHSMSHVTFRLAGECAARLAEGKALPDFAGLAPAMPLDRGK